LRLANAVPLRLPALSFTTVSYEKFAVNDQTPIMAKDFSCRLVNRSPAGRCVSPLKSVFRKRIVD
jgi:hypothetical protein